MLAGRKSFKEQIKNKVVGCLPSCQKILEILVGNQKERFGPTVNYYYFNLQSPSSQDILESPGMPSFGCLEKNCEIYFSNIIIPVIASCL